MRINSKLANKVAGLALATTVRTWMHTLDIRVALYEPSVDPARPDCRQRGIYIFWHEYIAAPLYLRGNCGLAMLMSRHRDADVLSRLALHFGFDFVRGSTARGGDQAVRELMRKGDSHHLAITPDGPRGPRRKLAAGCIFLASKTQMPLVVMGMGYDRPWRLGTWDHCAIPRPFSRARVVVSPRLFIPPHLARDGVEHYRQRVQRLLARLTQEAEAWAAAGSRKTGEIVVHPSAQPLRSHAELLMTQLIDRRGDAPCPAPHVRRRAA